MRINIIIVLIYNIIFTFFHIIGAFPDKNQYQELLKLSNNGHGVFHRLYYQLDQFTREVKVNTKALIINNQANNNSDIKLQISEFVTHAVTFQDILDLLNTQNYGTHESKYFL